MLSLARALYDGEEFIVAMAREDDPIHYPHACMRALLLFVFAKRIPLLIMEVESVSFARISNRRHKGY